MSFTPDDLRRLVRLLEVTEEDEIDCTQFLHRVAGYLERLGPDGAPPQGYEDVHQHLRACPECLEELEALRRALRLEGGAGSAAGG